MKKSNEVKIAYADAEPIKIRKKVLITPEIAEKYLAMSDKNRTIRQNFVERYANDMTNGDWYYPTGENIHFDTNNHLINGHHRLLACKKSGACFFSDIAFGLHPEVFKILDTNAVRGAADAYKLAGVKYYADAPAIIQNYHLIKQNMTADSAGGGTFKRRRRLTSSQSLSFYFNNQTFWEAVITSAKLRYSRFGKVLPSSLIGGLYAFLFHIDEVAADSFMKQLCEGLDVEHDVIYALRNKLIDDNKSYRRMTPKYRLALILKTWNIWRTKSPVAKLMFTPEKEEFPVAI